MFKDGDFLYVEFTGKVKDTDQIVETTSEEAAKKADIYDERKEYGPRLVILGEKSLIQGLEEALYPMEVNQEREVVIEPSKGFGERDQNKVKIIPKNRFSKPSELHEGSIVQTEDGEIGIIKSITGGRVVVDFNHPYAGRTLVYTVKVVSKLENTNEKLEALIRRNFGSKNAGKFKHQFSQDNSKIILQTPEELLLSNNLQIAKMLLARDIVKYVDEKIIIDFIDEFTKSTVEK